MCEGERDSMAPNRYMVGVVFLTFFAISLLTNIFASHRSGHHPQFSAAGFPAFAFFIAYGVVSIPVVKYQGSFSGMLGTGIISG